MRKEQAQSTVRHNTSQTSRPSTLIQKQLQTATVSSPTATCSIQQQHQMKKLRGHTTQGQQTEQREDQDHLTQDHNVPAHRPPRDRPDTQEPDRFRICTPRVTSWTGYEILTALKIHSVSSLNYIMQKITFIMIFYLGWSNIYSFYNKK